MADKIPTAEEMEQRIVRFRPDQVNFHSQHSEHSGIPTEVFDRFSPNTVYPLLIPEGFQGRQEGAMLTGPAGLVVDLTVCPPGTGPALHRHTTVENFLCLSGEFEIVWGERGEEKTSIRQFDFVSVPPGVFRTFRNVSDEPAWLLVLIQITTEEQRDDVDLGRVLADQLASEYGEDMVGKLEEIGFRFESSDVSDSQSRTK